MKLRVLDLFSGIGGFSLGLERTGGFETVAFCEIDPFCRRVLAKHWPGVPIYDDVRELTADALQRDRIAADVITAGFPCQDLSLLGAQAGIDGERSGLWREVVRLARDVRPRFIIMENVTALLTDGMGRVLGGLAAIGFHAEWHGIRASRAGLPHHRDRVWVVAYPDSERLQRRASEGPIIRAETLPLSDVRDEVPTAFITHGHDGLPREVVRTQHPSKALGNAVVPQIPELIGRAILQAERAA